MSAHVETTMLLGEYAKPIGDDGQVLLPVEVVTALGEDLIVTRGLERNLLLLSRDRFQELAAKLLERPLSKPEARALRRRLFSAATELKVAADGRVRLPKALAEFAGINGELILAGMYQYAEIWSKDNWVPVIEAATADVADAFWTDLGV